jgi:GNAT superfamily N-acetyltransferase
VVATVEVAAALDVEAVAGSLAAAFFDDPVMQWLIPDDRARTSRLARLFRTFLRHHYIELGSVWTTSDRSAAALWAPPGRAIVPPARIALQMPSVVRTFGRNVYIALRMFTHVESLHPKEPHWYLGVLGTRPERQGSGLGSALMHPVLERCDAEGIGAYLESSKESNIAFYHRFGFELRGEIHPPSGHGPPVWPMWRDPRPAA